MTSHRPCQKLVLTPDMRESITDLFGMLGTIVQFTKTAGSKCPSYHLIITTGTDLCRVWFPYDGSYRVKVMNWFIKMVRNCAFQTNMNSMLTCGLG